MNYSTAGKRRVSAAAICLQALLLAGPALTPACAQQAAPPYGNNAAVGRYAQVNGVKLYYEIYGQGEPLLLIHGNGGKISGFKKQIDYFRKKYQVIAVDSREQGKSSDTTEEITYEKMAADFNALLGQLKTGPVYVLGWSDGAINALLLGIHYPDKVKKIAAMAANLNPDEQAVYPDVWAWSHGMIDGMPAAARETPEGKRAIKVTSMMFSHPHIPFEDLHKISAPTLVLAGDHDLIRDEHTLEIFHHIPQSQLCIFPDATHLIPWQRPNDFNTAVDRFFREPFRKKDRIKDIEKDLLDLLAN
jgi:pimeloyl-ACP methyl ester carboxylesterase